MFDELYIFMSSTSSTDLPVPLRFIKVILLFDTSLATLLRTLRATLHFLEKKSFFDLVFFEIFYQARASSTLP